MVQGLALHFFYRITCSAIASKASGLYIELSMLSPDQKIFNIETELPVSLSQSMSSLSACSPHRTVPQITNHGMAYIPSFFPGAKSSLPSLSSLAYASGNNIAFNMRQEKLLVVHELQHVVQQRAGSMQHQESHKYPIQDIP